MANLSVDSSKSYIHADPEAVKAAGKYIADKAKEVKEAAVGKKGAEIAKEALKGAAIGGAAGAVLPGLPMVAGAAIGAAVGATKEVVEQTEDKNRKKALAGGIAGTLILGPVIGLPLGVLAAKKLCSPEAKEGLKKMLDFIKKHPEALAAKAGGDK